MAVTTKKTFPATSNSTTTTFTPVGIELNNQYDLDVYVTKTTAGIAANNGLRIKHYNQSTNSNLDANHEQVNDTTGLYFPALTHTGGTETLENYTISSDNNTITFNTALPSGAIVSIERRTRDGSGNYTTFASGTTIRHTDLNSSSQESNYTAQDARNKAFDLENRLFYSDFTPDRDDSIDLGSSTKQWKDLYVDGVAYLDEIDLEDDQKIKLGTSDAFTIEYSSSDANIKTTTGDIVIDAKDWIKLDIDGSSVVDFTGAGSGSQARIYTTLRPASDDTYDLGASGYEWRNLYVDGTAHIDTLTVDENATVAGTLDVTGNTTVGNTTVGGTLGVTGNVTFNGDTTLGDVAGDKIYLKGRINQDIVPQSTSINLGQSGANRWGNAYVTTLDVNGSATVDNIQLNGNEIDTTSGNLTIDSAGGTVTVDDNLTVNGTVDLDNITGDAVVTSGTSTSDTKVYSAKRAGEIFYEKGTLDDITSGNTWVADDNKLATTAAIDARIIDLVDDVGGFVPLASEADFPATNPDVNNGAGTIVSVGVLGATYTPNGSGQAIIPDSTLTNISGSNVMITDCGSTELAEGYGLLVETTSILHVYKFHRLTPKATEVTTVAGNISNINSVVNNATNINTVAGKDTEIGRLGTADAVADMNLLGTQVNVDRMSYLGVAGTVVNMSVLGTSAVVSDMDTLADISSNITTVAGISSNVTTVAGIAANVTTVAGDTTAINNITTNLTAINNITTNLTAVQNAATNATTATTQATNAASSATSAASSASTATTQASTATTQANNASTSAADALAYRNTALAHRDSASGILTQVESAPYNLADNVSSHTAWGDITDTGANAVFANESSNIHLTMSEGSSTYNYGSIT